MPRLIDKLLKGNRETHRLKDEKGNLVSVSRFFRNGPRAAASFVGRKVFNLRPPVPWISYDARRTLLNLLPSQSSILEFGSGMSTVWYAQHFGQVFSVEDNEGWYQQVRQLLTVRAPLNVHYHFHQGSAYCNYSEAASQPFDFAMVDGSDRSGCMKFALAHVKKDSLVYLDNSDKHPGGGDTRGAEAQLLEAVRDRAGRCIYFTDFAPTDLFVNQGLLGAFGRYSGLV